MLIATDRFRTLCDRENVVIDVCKAEDILDQTLYETMLEHGSRLLHESESGRYYVVFAFLVSPEDAKDIIEARGPINLHLLPNGDNDHPEPAE